MSDVLSYPVCYLDRVIEEDIGDNDGWASFLKLLQKASGCPIWLMIGARRIGKTDVALHIALLLWKKYSRKTMLVLYVMRNIDAAK